LDARTFATTEVDGDGAGSVGQQAADYLEIEDGAGDMFRFEGANEVSIGVPEHDGAFWWSNRGDSIDSRLTREIDLSAVSSATLTFDTWYDIEDGWDYAYVAVSTDGGKTWVTVPGELTTTDDPVGHSYGDGYTGRSGGWSSESVDLSDYAGSEVMIRFEYVTDDAASLTGFAIDNIAVEEAGFADDVEDDGGWDAEGFVRVERPLEQRWALRLINADGGVQQVPVNDDGSAEVLLGGAPATIIVAALTKGTAEPASYAWTLSP
jgi:bacillopeptidase F (M6 metalloprotease family)